MQCIGGDEHAGQELPRGWGGHGLHADQTARQRASQIARQQDNPAYLEDNPVAANGHGAD